eukprot:2226717-Pleurochrysis_carterae.AAC.2
MPGHEMQIQMANTDNSHRTTVTTYLSANQCAMAMRDGAIQARWPCAIRRYNKEATFLELRRSEGERLILLILLLRRSCPLTPPSPYKAQGSNDRRALSRTRHTTKNSTHNKFRDTSQTEPNHCLAIVGAYLAISKTKTTDMLSNHATC